ncbi:MAG: cytochrome c biogenesis protein CcsA [Fimbriimonadaceae bacterium]
MRLAGRTGYISLWACAAVATAVTVLLPDAKSFREPSLAKIVATHLPCAVLTTVFVVLSAVLGIRFLARREMSLDHRQAASSELGLIFAGLTMATGIQFSQVQWGAWWQWDARQTSFLVVLMLMAAGVTLRWAIPDPARRAASSAAYSVASLLPVLFLVFVLPRLPQVQAASFHPSRTVETGGFDTSYWTGILVMAAALSLWARAAYTSKHKSLTDEHDIDRPAASPSGVVVPLDVPEEH